MHESVSEVEAAHDAAVSAGEDLYLDPLTGLWAMTGPALAARGYCCGCGCRHCPYPGDETDDASGGTSDHA